LDAVDPNAPLQDYYAFRSEQEDGGYLNQLVRTCQTCLCLLPSYEKVQPTVTELVAYYCDLQVYKHIAFEQRVPRLTSWWERHKDAAPEYRWNEFAAATGSTLGMFTLFLAATDPYLQEEEVNSIRKAYFPSLQALHILLDYLIDQDEDMHGGDLNFCSYFENEGVMIERLEAIARQARERSTSLKHPRFHRMI